MFLTLYCNAAPQNLADLEPQKLKQLIIPASADRTDRFNAVDIAISNYPESAPVWIAQGLTNTPDIEVAELLLLKLEILSHPAAVKYLAMYRPHNDTFKARAIGLCERISGTKHPLYALAIVNTDQSISDDYEFQIIFDTCRIWENLNLDRNYAEKWLRSITPANTITKTLKFCLDQFNYIPSTFIEIVQYRKLENKTEAEILSLKDKISNLADYDYHFSIGDLGLIETLPIETLKSARNSLETFISEYIQTASHISRPPAYKKAANDKPDEFDSQKDSLSIADLHRIKLTIEYLSQDNHQDITRSITQPADKSEIGGLIHFKQNKLKFQYYTPGKAIGHHRYIESQKLLSDSHNAFARWHIHDQRKTTRNLAGPGIDDIKYATSLKTSIVIITLIKDSTAGISANVDYINKDGTIIDIGVININ